MSLSLKQVGRYVGYGFLAAVVGGSSAVFGMVAVIYGLVQFGDDSHLKKATIMARINEETNIYMLDEKTPIGSIFNDAHRRYVPIEEIPSVMINAIVAAEDKNFYEHHGIDPVAIVSAAAGVLKGGRVRGASTLTQQTARNILGWWDVTLSRKVREAIAALQLEKMYSKKQILEFYLNQFHVSGNGRGIGIAAKYYFNKEVSELDLVEAAFIAGSVKGPSQYDPFIKFTKERREAAIRRAFHRKNYVLGRMHEQGWITDAQYKEAKDAPVKFNRGSFRTEQVALVQLITQQLEKKEILETLGIEDPRELTSAGLKVFTTIDGDMQQAGQLAVRRNLSRLETILKGFKQEKDENFQPLRNLTVNNFYYGKVSGIEGTPKEPELKINFGLPSCKVPYDSLMRYAKQMDLPYGQGWQKVVVDLVKKIQINDVLYVEVLDYNVETHEGICEMMKRPRVNGGLVALDKGEVRAVVSGFDTHGFNRSMQAKRQPGSVFKPVVYFAALQLGWSVLDRLDNERQLFPFQGQFYYPRPDHVSPYKEVSMLWAGVMSENCASVSLTSKLVEKLTFDQYKQLLGVMDLLPHPGEAPRDFHFRVARAMGVQLDNDGVREFQLNPAVSDLMLDVQYSTTFEYQQKLKKMWWGRGHANEMQQILLAKDDLSAHQKVEKLKLASNNFLRHQALAAQLRTDWGLIESAVGSKGPEQALSDAVIARVLARFRVLPGLSKPALGYVFIQDGERPERDYKYKGDLEKILQPSGRPLSALDVQAIWGGSALFGNAGIALSDVLIDGWLPAGHQDSLEKYVNNHYDEVMSRQDEYDLFRYYNHHDYRIAVGLNYLVSLAKAMGVTSPVEPVLSFPLGTNVVTLSEVAKIYQTFVSGKTYQFYKDGAPNQINLIRRIEDRNGNILFEPKRREYQLVNHEFGLQMRELLRRVVTHGTGRRANAELYLTLNPGEVANEKDPRKALALEQRVRIPAFGKTGTTNDYNNANFAGFMPYPVNKGEPLDPDNSYVLAAYTGYDLNKQMKAGAISVTGAIGALPAWIGLANEIIQKKKFIDLVDPLDINLIARKEWPLKKEARATPVLSDLPSGVLAGGSGGGEEVAAMSNSAKEGESATDEFRATSVQAVLSMPLDGGKPLRMFSPYKPQKDSASKPTEEVIRQVSTPRPSDEPKDEVEPALQDSKPAGDPMDVVKDIGGEPSNVDSSPTKIKEGVIIEEDLW